MTSPSRREPGVVGGFPELVRCAQLVGRTKNHRNRTIVLPAFRSEMLNDHLLEHTPSVAENLAAKLDPVWRDSRPDKGRTKPTLLSVDGKPPDPEAP